MALVTVVAMLALAEYLFFAFQVGQARSRTDTPAPRTTGNEEFERYFRVQQNTMEQAIVFFPALFAAGWFGNPVFAAVVGLAFVAGRFIYFKAYVQDPDSRGLGMIITFLANVALLLGGFIGALLSLF